MKVLPGSSVLVSWLRLMNHHYSSWLMETSGWKGSGWLWINNFSPFPVILLDFLFWLLLLFCLFYFATTHVWVASQAYPNNTNSSFYWSRDPHSQSKSDTATVWVSSVHKKLVSDSTDSQNWPGSLEQTSPNVDFTKYRTKYIHYQFNNTFNVQV